MDAIVNITIMSVFCAGGLFAYVREAMRLDRLMSAGKIASARIVSLEKDDSGSESVVHYLVRYVFVDDAGRTLTHEQDLNSGKYFSNLAIGNTIDVLYGADSGNSYPVRQIQRDWRMSWYIALAILAFWTAMTVFFVLTK